MNKSGTCTTADKGGTSHFSVIVEWSFIILISSIYAGSTAFLVALVTIPAAYQERGYWAIGGEWIAVLGSFVITFLVSRKLMRGEFI